MTVDGAATGLPPLPSTVPSDGLEDLGAACARISQSIEQVIEGKPEVVRLALTVLLAEGHLLIEDVPGVGKTMLAKALARSIDCSVRRIQFTPDLLPCDVTGVSVYNQETPGVRVQARAPSSPTSCVGDEINRASPKTQSALLECMEERQVTVDGTTYELAAPFMVIATQNPVEMEGTYPLPEAQRDRFMARVSMGYPDPEAELAMLDTHGAASPLDDLRPVATADDVTPAGRGRPRRPRQRRRPPLRRRPGRPPPAPPPTLRLGASPRATLHLVRAARACGGPRRPRLRPARRRADARRPGAGAPAAAHRGGPGRPAHPEQIVADLVAAADPRPPHGRAT